MIGIERVVTGAVIVGDEKKVLLEKKKHGLDAGQWALVGGKPEGTESPLETIIRKIGEKLGRNFINHILWKEMINETSVPGEYRHIYFYIGNIDGEPTPPPEEITEVGWFEINKIGELDIAFDHKEVLMELFAKKIIS